MWNKRISLEEKLEKILNNYNLKFKKYKNQEWKDLFHLWIENVEWDVWSNREWLSIYRLIDNFYQRIIEVGEENKPLYNWKDKVCEEQESGWSIDV